MWLFIAGAMLGGFVGIGLICLLQINRNQDLIEHSNEEK